MSLGAAAPGTGVGFGAADGNACAFQGGFGPSFQRGDARGNQYAQGGQFHAPGLTRQDAGKILPGTVVGDEHRQPGQVGQAVNMLIKQMTCGSVRQRGRVQAVQRSRYLILSLTPAHSSASGSGPLLSMMTFHSLASWALSAM